MLLKIFFPGRWTYLENPSNNYLVVRNSLKNFQLKFVLWFYKDFFMKTICLLSIFQAPPAKSRMLNLIVDYQSCFYEVKNGLKRYICEGVGSPVPGDGAAQGLRCLQIRQAAHRGGLAGQDIRTLGPFCLYRYLSKFNSNII